MRSRRWLSTLLLCLILFAKLYETKGATTTRERRSIIQNGRNSALRNPIKRYHGHRWRKNFFSGKNLVNPKTLIELIQKTPLERRKRRKRQPGFMSHPHYRIHYRLSDLAPTNKRIVCLQSRTGYYLEILPDGKVGGNINRTKFTKMEMQVISSEIKRIRGVGTGMYLGINQKGKVVSKNNPDAETYFLETISENNFDHHLSSVRYPASFDPFTTLPWFLALRKKNGRRGVYGKTKRASRTFRGEYATQFSILDDDK